jgi:hypothetical protein
MGDGSWGAADGESQRRGEAQTRRRGDAQTGQTQRPAEAGRRVSKAQEGPEGGDGVQPLPPTANRRPPTVNRQPPTANRQPPTADRQPPTVNPL